MKSQTELIPFHQWKAEQIACDSKQHQVQRYYRPRDWYYKAYGDYCNKQRALRSQSVVA